MSDVKSHSPSPAARSPKHPDHARWVKEQTLAIEVEHSKLTGGTLRDAEDANTRSLERLAGRAREPVRRDPKPGTRNPSVAERQAKRELEQGVTYKPVAPVTVVPQRRCKMCGRCEECRREARMSLIMAKGREGDSDLNWLALQFCALLFAFQKRIDCKIAPSRLARGREVAFSRLNQRQRVRAFIDAIGAVCDWSARWLGAWR